MKKRIMSILLSLVIIAPLLLVVAGTNVLASSSESEVKAKIEAMARGDYGKKYKAGNYWNQMITSPCASNGSYGHKNKDPNPDTDKWYTVKINGSTREGCQCYGFAFAVFDKLFGGGDGDNIQCETITYSGSGSKKDWIISNARVGDLINIKAKGETNGHYGIFYKYDSNYLYFYDANGYANGGTCRISITEKRPWSDSKLANGTSAYILRAKNYIISTESTKVEDYYLLTSPDGVQTMRSSDSTSASKILDIPANTIVCVTKYNSDGKWGYVTYNGKSGWIRLYYVEKHSHSYGSWNTTKAATCTATGTQKRTCSCGKYETKSISALGHSYSSSYTTDKSATCTSAGSKSRHCSRCSATTDVTAISAKGHDFGQWQTTKNATCTVLGSQQRVCSECSAVETKSIAAKGHTYSNNFTVDKAATCTSAGSKSRHCINCSAKTDVTTASALSHSFGEWQTEKEATKSSAGQAVRKCTRSGCTESESKTIAKLSEDGHQHKYGQWQMVKEATCTQDGVSERKCSICSASETAAISHTGHDFGQWQTVKEATETAEGEEQRKCSGCGQTESQKTQKLPQSIGTGEASSVTESEQENQQQEKEEEQLEISSQSGEGNSSQDAKINWLAVAVVALALMLAGAVAAIVILAVKKRG